MVKQPPASSVNLEFEFGATPIQGFLRAPDGSRTWFWGWLELMALLTTITRSRVAREDEGTPVEITR